MCNLYIVVKVGGGMGQGPATEVTYLRLNLQLQIATTTSLLTERFFYCENVCSLS